MIPTAIWKETTEEEGGEVSSHVDSLRLEERASLTSPRSPAKSNLSAIHLATLARSEEEEEKEKSAVNEVESAREGEEEGNERGREGWETDRGRMRERGLESNLARGR